MIVKTGVLLPSVMLLIGACSADNRDSMSERDNADSASDWMTYVFVCDDESHVTVRGNDSEAWVFRAAGTIKLAASAAGAQANYQNETLELKIVGDNATFTEAGAKPVRCQNDRRSAIWEHAKLNGADFRAVGNEPGWTLEIQQGSRIVLLADYGATRFETPLPEPTVDAEARTTIWDAGELELKLIGDRCVDSMSGEVFEAKAEVIWRGQTLSGCGRALH